MMLLPLLLTASLADPFIGSAWTGNTHPGASCPFGLVQPGPDSGNGDWHHCSGYRYRDAEVYGFSQTHLSGTGCADLGDVRLLPFTGALPGSVAWAHGFKDAEREQAEPGYYSTVLSNFAVRAEMTATRRVAYHRYSRIGAGRLSVLVDPQWGLVAHGREEVESHLMSYSGAGDENTRTIRGSFEHRAWLHRRVGFIVRFDRAFAAVRTIPPQGKEKADRYVVDFELGEGEPLGVEVAISSVDAEGAERNLAAEGGRTFESVREAAMAEWEKLFSIVEIPGAGEDQRKNFYTALYHLFLQPNLLSDVDGRYRGADGKVARSEDGMYSGFSLWDTYRAAHPLYSLLIPELNGRFIASLMSEYRRNGFLPVIPYFGCESYCMIGNHAVPVVVDAVLKGDYPISREVFEAVTNSLTVAHIGPDGRPKLKEHWAVLDKYGYYPFDLIKGEGVSRTLECAYDDACAARLAEKLGEKASAEFFKARSGNWRNVFDRQLGLVRGRDSSGKWREPFDPYRFGGGGEWEPYDCTEGNAWQYTWSVQHDPEGLIGMFGGKAEFVRRLDSVFRMPETLSGAAKHDDTTGLIGQYVHGNEPSHHIGYLYQYAERPDRTAEVVREVCERFYLPKPDGLCGNDDCGQMSAWYIFACMGFYPVDPCGGDYVLGAPQLPKVVLRLPSVGPRPCATADAPAFTIVAKNLSKKNKYVKSVTLNGKQLKGFILHHFEIMRGGELVFEMTAYPSEPANGEGCK